MRRQANEPKVPLDRQSDDPDLRRHEARDSKWVENGAFKRIPLGQETERDRRNNSWPGYHTEFCGHDVCH
mgnify:CR=1 FL=1